MHLQQDRVSQHQVQQRRWRSSADVLSNDLFHGLGFRQEFNVVNRQAVLFRRRFVFYQVRHIERSHVVLPENVQALHLANGCDLSHDAQVLQEQSGRSRHRRHERSELVDVTALAVGDSKGQHHQVNLGTKNGCLRFLRPNQESARDK